MRLYNTLSRQTEDFQPLEQNKVKFYQCGPTVYWTQHIGNMRAMTMSDLIRRTLLYLNYEVTFVRNYTDVGHLTGDNIGNADSGEDRMEKGAKREGLSPQHLADKYIDIFEKDIAALNILDPDHKPRATAYIPQIIEMVQTLVDKGYAYTTPRAVYFDVTKAKDYTKLSGQKLEENQQGAGTGDVNDPGKRHPQDFAVWFFKTGIHKNALQYWPSPFKSIEVNNGEGFPGWHIECSSMIKSILGNTIDIHMGGVEHISIHHTNEIAQSEAANGVKFVNYWLHNEHLVVNESKMAKSEGTGFSLAEVIEKGYDPLALRYFFLNAHYRSKQNFTWDNLYAAQTALQKLRGYAREYKESPPFPINIGKKIKEQFNQAIENDFNIPQALAVTWEMVKSELPAGEKRVLLFQFDKVLGLQLEEYEAEKIPNEIIKLAQQRVQAKNEKNFAKSDELRKQISEKGYTIEDTPQGYRIKKA